MPDNNEISLAALSPPPLILRIADDLRVVIPPPSVRTVSELYQIEKAITEAADATENEAEFFDAQARGSDYIVGLLQKYEPKVPDDLELTTTAVLALIRSIVQGPSAAAVIQQAITGGGLVDAAQLARNREEGGDGGDGAEGEAKPKKAKRPLASKKPSSARSSSSANGTAGSRNGGSTPAARSRRSASTSRRRSAG